MPLIVRYVGTMPAGTVARFDAIVTAINQSGLYADRVFNATLRFDPTDFPFPIGLSASMTGLSGLTNGNRNIWMNLNHDGDRPLEDRFIHELTHVLHPGLATAAAIGEHPPAFYAAISKLYEGIDREFNIIDSKYATDSQIHKKYFGPTTVLPKCFLAGTPIDMADGTQKPIEQIMPGDMVMSFDGAANNGRGALVPQRVTRTMQNVTNTVIDLRGLKVTPGHVFPTGEGDFAQIRHILRDDRTIVERDGRIVRARTGVPVNAPGDIPIRIEYTDPESRVARVVIARAGISCQITPDGSYYVTLADVIHLRGATIRPDGLIERDGEVFLHIEWPVRLSATPMDLPMQQNFVVRDQKDAPYTPEWCRDLEDAREGMLEIVNGPGKGRMFASAHMSSARGGTNAPINRAARRKVAALRRVK